MDAVRPDSLDLTEIQARLNSNHGLPITLLVNSERYDAVSYLNVYSINVYNDKSYYDNPLNHFMSMILHIHSGLFLQSNFIFREHAEKHPSTMFFVLSIMLEPTELMYKTFEEDFLGQIQDHEKVVHLRQPLYAESSVCDFSEKVFTLIDELYTFDRKLLLRALFTFGTVDRSTRKLTHPPAELQGKIGLFYPNFSPHSRVVIKEIPEGLSCLYDVDIVRRYIDGNNHTNLNTYFQSGAETIWKNLDPAKQFGNCSKFWKQNPLKELSILFRRESVLGDHLRCYAWKENLPSGPLSICRIERHAGLEPSVCVFLEAKFAVSYQSHL